MEVLQSSTQTRRVVSTVDGTILGSSSQTTDLLLQLHPRRRLEPNLPLTTTLPTTPT